MEQQIATGLSKGACCLHLHDLTSRLAECQFEDITILRNIVTVTSRPAWIFSCRSLKARKIARGFGGVVKKPGTVSCGWIHLDLRNSSCSEHRRALKSPTAKLKLNRVGGFFETSLDLYQTTRVTSQNLKSRELLKFCAVIKNRFWNQGFKSHSENLTAVLADYFNTWS